MNDIKDEGNTSDLENAKTNVNAKVNSTNGRIPSKNPRASNAFIRKEQQKIMSKYRRFK